MASPDDTRKNDGMDNSGDPTPETTSEPRNSAEHKPGGTIGDTDDRNPKLAGVDTVRQLEYRLTLLENKQKGFALRIGPIMVATLALLFSFGTTYVSYHRANQEELQSTRTELRQLIQRLVTLPRELLISTRNDPKSRSALGRLSQAEAQVIAGQAVELIDRFPNDAASKEYYGVAVALLNAGMFDAGFRLLKQANDRAQTASDKVQALRTLGVHYFETGRLDKGRESFKQALSVFSDFPTKVEGYEHMIHARTELNWSGIEFSLKNRDLAKQHLDKAKQHTAKLKLGSLKDMYMQEIAIAKESLSRNAALDTAPSQSFVPIRPGTQRP